MSAHPQQLCYSAYLIQRLQTTANHVLFYVVDQEERAHLAVVGTDVRLSGHFVYCSVPGFVGAPAIRCTNRAQVMDWLAAMGASTCATAGQVHVPPMTRQQLDMLISIDPMFSKPQLDREYSSWREHTCKMSDGRHLKQFFLVDTASGSELLVVTGEDGARRDRRYIYKAVPELGGWAFENGQAVKDWLNFVTGSGGTQTRGGQPLRITSSAALLSDPALPQLKRQHSQVLLPQDLGLPQRPLAGQPGPKRVRQLAMPSDLAAGASPAVGGTVGGDAAVVIGSAPAARASSTGVGMVYLPADIWAASQLGYRSLAAGAALLNPAGSMQALHSPPSLQDAECVGAGAAAPAWLPHCGALTLKDTMLAMQHVTSAPALLMGAPDAATTTTLTACAVGTQPLLPVPPTTPSRSYLAQQQPQQEQTSRSLTQTATTSAWPAVSRSEVTRSGSPALVHSLAGVMSRAASQGPAYPAALAVERPTHSVHSAADGDGTALLNPGAPTSGHGRRKLLEQVSVATSNASTSTAVATVKRALALSAAANSAPQPLWCAIPALPATSTQPAPPQLTLPDNHGGSSHRGSSGLPAPSAPLGQGQSHSGGASGALGRTLTSFKEALPPQVAPAGAPGGTSGSTTEELPSVAAATAALLAASRSAESEGVLRWQHLALLVTTSAAAADDGEPACDACAAEAAEASTAQGGLTVSPAVGPVAPADAVPALITASSVTSAISHGAAASQGVDSQGGHAEQKLSLPPVSTPPPPLVVVALSTAAEVVRAFEGAGRLFDFVSAVPDPATLARADMWVQRLQRAHAALTALSVEDAGVARGANDGGGGTATPGAAGNGAIRLAMEGAGAAGVGAPWAAAAVEELLSTLRALHSERMTLRLLEATQVARVVSTLCLCWHAEVAAHASALLSSWRQVAHTALTHATSALRQQQEQERRPHEKQQPELRPSPKAAEVLQQHTPQLLAAV